MQPEPRILPRELKSRQDAGDAPTLLDVRTSTERAIASLGGVHIPLDELSKRVAELDPTAEIVVFCHHGIRSAHAVSFLRAAGFSRARNLVGGIDQWSREIDPAVPMY